MAIRTSMKSTSEPNSTPNTARKELAEEDKIALALVKDRFVESSAASCYSSCPNSPSEYNRNVCMASAAKLGQSPEGVNIYNARDGHRLGNKAPETFNITTDFAGSLSHNAGTPSAIFAGIKYARKTFPQAPQYYVGTPNNPEVKEIVDFWTIGRNDYDNLHLVQTKTVFDEAVRNAETLGVTNASDFHLLTAAALVRQIAERLQDDSGVRITPVLNGDPGIEANSLMNLFKSRGGIVLDSAQTKPQQTKKLRTLLCQCCDARAAFEAFGDDARYCHSVSAIPTPAETQQAVKDGADLIVVEGHPDCGGIKGMITREKIFGIQDIAKPSDGHLNLWLRQGDSTTERVFRAIDANRDFFGDISDLKRLELLTRCVKMRSAERTASETATAIGVSVPSAACYRDFNGVTEFLPWRTDTTVEQVYLRMIDPSLKIIVSSTNGNFAKPQECALKVATQRQQTPWAKLLRMTLA